jgi:opacity protein-like surface antigen
MKRLAVVLAVAAAMLASTASASHVVSNTGWFCPTLGQIVNAGGGYSYVCWSYRWFLVHREG